LNINQLQYLRELIHAGSFSRAAENLGISQPALSTQIRNLEEETGLILVNRHKKPIQLTRDGESYFDLATEILDRVELLLDLPILLTSEITGSLRVGIIPTLAPYLISLFIDLLEEKYPGLEFIVEEMLTETIVQNIRTGHLDAGIISTPIAADNLNFKPLFYEKFYLYVSDRHPYYHKDEIYPGEIDEKDIWYLREGNCFTNQVNSICRLAGNSGANSNLKYYTNSIESLRRIVEKEHGITFLPELATINIPSEYEDMIKPLAGKQAVREISMISTTHLIKKRHLDAVAKVLLSQLPAHMLRKPSDWIVDTDLKL